MRLRFYILLCLLMAAFASGVTHAYGDERPEVRVIHASPDLGAVDVYLNDIFAGHLDFGLGGQFISVAQGAVILTARSEDGTEVFSGELTAHNDQVVNAVVMGTSDNLTLNAYPVDRSSLEFGMSRVNIVNALTNFESTRLLVTSWISGAPTLSAELTFGENIAHEMPADSYSLVEGLNYNGFNAGTTYTAILIDSMEDDQIVDTLVFGNAVQLDGAAGNLRFVNALPEGTSLDLYLNNTFVARMPSSTAYLAVEPGSYEMALRAADSDPNSDALFESTIEVTENDWLTGVVTANDSGLDLTLYSDDLSVVAEGQARISVFNATTTDATLSSGGSILDATAGQISDFQLIETGAQQIVITVGDIVYEVDFDISANTPFNLRSIIISNDGPIVLTACALP